MLFRSMSLLGQDVRTFLLSKSAITSLIGTRMFPDVIPEKGIFPALVYFQVSQVPQHTLPATAGFAWSRIQFDAYATGSTGASQRDALVEALRNELDAFPAPGTTPTMGGSTVNAVVYKNSRDIYEPPQDNSDIGFFRNSMDYMFRHQIGRAHV